MSEVVEIWEKPKADVIYMIAGWRQWADAGSVSSGLPAYLIRQMNARQIGEIRPEGFYLFQFPGTHDLVRPTVKFVDGYPEMLEIPHNEIFYAGNQKQGTVLFLGDEPQLDVERYVAAFLHTARALGVKRIIGLGGVYGEVPYEKARSFSCVYSMPHLKRQVQDLAVSLSDYLGGASIGSYICKRAGEQGLEYISFYAFVPTYDFSGISQIENAIRIENDFMAWLGVMRRLNYMLKLGFDLSDLEEKSQRLVQIVDQKLEELDSLAPQHRVREYLERISGEFEEMPFDPLDDFWEDELRRLFDKLDEDES